MNTKRLLLFLTSSSVWLCVLTLVSISVQCGHDQKYTLHIGQSFYPLDQLSHERFYGRDVLRDEIGKTVHLQGIYTLADSVFIDFPMLRFHTAEEGLFYALLDTALDALDGDFVEIAGTVDRRMIRLKGTKMSYKEELLRPDTYRTVRPSHTVKRIAQNEYLKIRGELQEKITPEGSNLILAEEPRWFLVWSKTDDRYIASARFSDLMYEADIDFVFTGTELKITDVYAVEWFKGE